MAEFHLEFLPAAMDDLDRIADYHLSMVSANSAERITDPILETLEHLEQNPYLGSSHPDPVLASMEYRRIVSGEYVCVHKVIEQSVVVYRIVHGATDYPKLFYQ